MYPEMQVKGKPNPGSQTCEEIGLHLRQVCQIPVIFDDHRLTCHGKIAGRKEAFSCCFHNQNHFKDVESSAVEVYETRMRAFG